MGISSTAGANGEFKQYVKGNKLRSATFGGDRWLPDSQVFADPPCFFPPGRPSSAKSQGEYEENVTRPYQENVTSE